MNSGNPLEAPIAVPSPSGTMRSCTNWGDSPSDEESLRAPQPCSVKQGKSHQPRSRPPSLPSTSQSGQSRVPMKCQPSSPVLETSSSCPREGFKSPDAVSSSFNVRTKVSKPSFPSLVTANIDEISMGDFVGSTPSQIC